jgi:hypothetical protein
MTPEQITAGARTVNHLATYFEEFKQAARELIEGARASGRGYFTPGEEEAVRRLQVSYTTSISISPAPTGWCAPRWSTAPTTGSAV